MALISPIYAQLAKISPLTKKEWAWQQKQKRKAEKRKLRVAMGIKPKRKNKPKPKQPTKRQRYALYLQSPIWKAKRLTILEDRGYKCENCQSRRSLQVHHLTYVRVGKELPEDLRLLCRNCHEKVHGIK